MAKNLPANADSLPGSGSSPGERNGNPLQYSSLGNPMDRGAWWATPGSWLHGYSPWGRRVRPLLSNQTTSIALY